MGSGIYGRTFEVYLVGSHFTLGEEVDNPFTGTKTRGWEGTMTDDELARATAVVEARGASIAEGAIVSLDARRDDPRRPYVILHDWGSGGAGLELYGDFDVCTSFVFELATAGNLVIFADEGPMATHAEVAARANAVPNGAYSPCALVTSARELREAFGPVVER